MSSMYPKNGRIYFRLKVDGKWTGVPTEFAVGQERAARAILDEYDLRVAAGEEVDPGMGPLTCRRWYAAWIKEREAQISTWANDEYVMRLHVLPFIGELRVDAVRPKHLVQLFRGLRRSLAPKSVYNAYSTVSSFFRDACLADLLPRHASPCILTKHQLGLKQDKDPEWRPKAVFSRGELETLITDERIPMDRRILYALEGVAGLRHGEAAGLHFRNCPVQPETPPLGMLFVAFSYERPFPKGGVTRPVPIHPTLAAMLAEWKLHGWAQMMGRQPTPDDHLLPLPPWAKSKRGRVRRRNYSHDRFEEDLLLLGMRHRRGHDLRRTMISLSRSDGADVAILKRATHKPPVEVIEGYTTYEWDVLCREVSKLKIQRRGVSEVASIPWAASVGGARLATGLATNSTQPSGVFMKTDLAPPGLEPRGMTHDDASSTASTTAPQVESRTCVDDSATQTPDDEGPATNTGSTVASRLRTLRLAFSKAGK